MSIQLSGVAHRYGRGAAILQDVNLEIGPGETVAIVGPSGSGKTTLISILGGLLRATEGDRRLDGRIATANVTVDMAWIFQGINLIAHRTALDNVRIGLLRSGMDAPMIDAAARRALDRVGLAQRADYRARALSGGEAQRVGVARALAGTPASSSPMSLPGTLTKRHHER